MQKKQEHLNCQWAREIDWFSNQLCPIKYECVKVSVSERCNKDLHMLCRIHKSSTRFGGDDKFVHIAEKQKQSQQSITRNQVQTCHKGICPTKKNTFGFCSFRLVIELDTVGKNSSFVCLLNNWLRYIPGLHGWWEILLFYSIWL